MSQLSNHTDAYTPTPADEAEYLSAHHCDREPDLSLSPSTPIGAWRQEHYSSHAPRRRTVRVQLGEHVVTLSRAQAFRLLNAVEGLLTRTGGAT